MLQRSALQAHGFFALAFILPVVLILLSISPHKSIASLLKLIGEFGRTAKAPVSTDRAAGSAGRACALARQHGSKRLLEICGIATSQK